MSVTVIMDYISSLTVCQTHATKKLHDDDNINQALAIVSVEYILNRYEWKPQKTSTVFIGIANNLFSGKFN